MRKWNPRNRTIKDTGRRVCDNTGCANTAMGAFEQGDAVWLACGECVPDGVEVVRLSPPPGAGRG
jgi:hypothetical protein